MGFLSLPELPRCDAETLAAAVKVVIERQASDAAAPSVGPAGLSGRLPSSMRFEKGAEELDRGSSEDLAAARHLMALLEAGYMIAAADGLATGERSALADLIVQVTGGAKITGERLATLFARFEEILASEGLESRLDAIADCFEDFMAREEAMSFAVLVAIADGELSDKEAAALIALGKRIDFSAGEVQAVVDSVAHALKSALADIAG